MNIKQLKIILKKKHGSASFLISFRNCQIVCSENDTRMLVKLMHNPQLENYTVGGLKKQIFIAKVKPSMRKKF